MSTKHLKNIFILLSIFIGFTVSDEFSDGPYGTSYFDIAGPFSISELNFSLQGEVNLDENVNIQDVILIINVILSWLIIQIQIKKGA